ncbi:phytanoyl-CoA dioxygenase family protein [Pseudonocardia acaciae]|uniref:phytanoyl-CoA dioxygenase family protein n=1 Tax=Pseudonocardia acaciae TaxID=551276 RepID=UPI0006870B76|nr:phytanoyl-CoA dioxygenase family protein [Pseudonocardia acaciae]
MASVTGATGYAVAHDCFDAAEVDALRAGVEAAARRATALASTAGTDTITPDGHRLRTVPGDPPTSVHWEPETERPTLRNLRPVTHLDDRLAARWDDPRLTAVAADLLGTPAVAPLTSKISFKRARVGSEFDWHRDHTFLARFLGAAAREVVTAMVLLDDAHAGNGALTLVPGSHLDDPAPDPTPVTLTASAGTVIFFRSRLLHRSDPNRSDTDRRALLYLYQPPGRPHLDEA